jgi:lysozyme
MKINITPAIRNKIFAAMVAAGMSGPVAYVASNHTVSSEGMYSSPYMDPVGLKTYCVGHLVKKNEVVKDDYSEDECIKLFVKDFTQHAERLSTMVTVPYRSEWMKGAAIDFTFHMGEGNVRSSTFLKELNAKHYDQACDQLTRWVYGKQNGIMVKMPGLVIRATERYKFCMGEIPADYSPTLQRLGVKVDAK